MDNVGTFDTLLPLLPQDLHYVAFDLPGHGVGRPAREGEAMHTTTT